VKTRAELQQREALARERADDAAVDRVLGAAKSHWLPRGGERSASGVVGVPIAGAKLTFGTLVLALREAPLVVVILIAVFLASETWQFFARLDGWEYAKIIGGLVVLMAAILVVGLRTELKAAQTIPRRDEDDEDRPSPPKPSPIEQPLIDAGFGDPPPGLTAPRSSRWTVGAQQVSRLVLLCLVVGLVAAALFTLVGATAVSPELAGSWSTRTGESPNHTVTELIDISLLGKHAETVTLELLLVSGAIGAIAALAFSVELVTGERLREELLRQRFAGYATAFRAWARLYHGEPPPPAPVAAAPAAGASSPPRPAPG
jgi:hypothetical protein